VQLFYLESRGIPRAEAVRMLVFGFFAGGRRPRRPPRRHRDVVLGEIEREIRIDEAMALTDPRRSTPAASGTATPDLTASGQA
jgi:hypothetical protein